MSEPAELTFYHGPMGAGKSTFALQTHFNQSRQGRVGLLLTKHDRSGEPAVTSRIGLAAPAVVVGDGDDLHDVVMHRHRRERLDFVVCDEAQFLAPAQVEDLVRIVDEVGIDVFAFGLLTDFTAALFPGSARLVELADGVHRMQAIVLCWCGRPGFLNARVVGGQVARAGELVAIGDTELGPVIYQALCRRHFMGGQLEE
ncbi:thymidine kinase [Gordonia insulae]|uniref:Thymidine kinase n=1 Tax=Gordonia insulae TaxID=2420509 RepID=A0A3G8JFH2_9ACTN|nr:thymidine kinase [Gordonia insulae]AZG43911.1 Thymidine kinase [Gordonia insulae]